MRARKRCILLVILSFLCVLCYSKNAGISGEPDNHVIFSKEEEENNMEEVSAKEVPLEVAIHSPSNFSKLPFFNKTITTTPDPSKLVLPKSDSDVIFSLDNFFPQIKQNLSSSNTLGDTISLQLSHANKTLYSDKEPDAPENTTTSNLPTSSSTTTTTQNPSTTTSQSSTKLLTSTIITTTTTLSPIQNMRKVLIKQFSEFNSTSLSSQSDDESYWSFELAKTLGIAAGCIVAIIVVALLFIFYQRRQNEAKPKPDPQMNALARHFWSTDEKSLSSLYATPQTQVKPPSTTPNSSVRESPNEMIFLDNDTFLESLEDIGRFDVDRETLRRSIIDDEKSTKV